MGISLRPVYWDNDAVAMIDQTLIPDEIKILRFTEYHDVINAIKMMQVRGAPAIGVAAALGMALAAQSINSKSPSEFISEFENIGNQFKTSRPTAINLFWAVDRMIDFACKNSMCEINTLRSKLIENAVQICEDDIEINKKIGEFGAGLLNNGDTVLTHCNAGALATAGFGTALGVIYAAFESGKNIKVIADETRPRLQGMRLTAWELLNAGVPVTVISDNMAAWVMSNGMVNCVVVGADRIAANGDTANKIGTYGLSLIAHMHNVPFYVAAPVSTIDIKLADGSMIPIEQRSADEVTHICGKRIAPAGVNVFNPSFDVTPAKYITAIITEKGILNPPYYDKIAELF